MANTTGYLKLIIGPMFAGKSTELVRVVARYKAIGKNVVAINHLLNCRYGTSQISTHDNRTLEQCLICEKLSDIEEDTIKNTDIIVVEELQFFPDALVTIQYWVDILGKTVIAAGLDGDYKKKPFGDVLQLIPHADDVVKLSALCAFCKDGTRGHFSLGKVITNRNGQIAVGGKTKYDAVCRKHYLLHHTKESSNDLDIPDSHELFETNEWGREKNPMSCEELCPNRPQLPVNRM